MKSIAVIITVITMLVFASCSTKKASLPINGTWQLLTGTLIEKGDTTVTNYSGNKKFIKIINDTHFAFLSHDLSKGKDSTTAFFSAGGGKYSIKDSIYTEHLEYCNDRQWENNDFQFVVSIRNDTLIQQGIEKVAGTNIDRLNIERYVRIK
jgi:hypothetical protein